MKRLIFGMPSNMKSTMIRLLGRKMLKSIIRPAVVESNDLAVVSLHCHLSSDDTDHTIFHESQLYPPKMKEVLETTMGNVLTTCIRWKPMTRLHRFHLRL